MLKAGFIGAGRRAQSAHYPSVSRLDDLEIEAVAELDESRAKTVMEGYHIPRYFTDHKKMLGSLDLDVVYVIMGAPQMTEVALDCMEAGKHVFIEKPAGASLEDSQRLHDSAVANGVYCMVGYQRRYAAVVQDAMRRVSAHGGPTLAIGEFHKFMPGGPVWGLSTLWTDVCHVVDLLRYMVGSEAVEVTSYRDSHQWRWVHCYNALIRFANNAVGIITANRSSGARYIRMELHGMGIGCYIGLPSPLEVYEDGAGPQVLTGSEIAGTDPADVHSYEGALAMHRHFAECISEGKTPISDIRDVIHTSRLIDQIEGVHGSTGLWPSRPDQKSEVSTWRVGGA